MKEVILHSYYSTTSVDSYYSTSIEVEVAWTKQVHPKFQWRIFMTGVFGTMVKMEE
jgi:hypothetical protein